MTGRLGDVADSAGSMAREAVDSATGAAREMDRTLRGESDQALSMLGALSVGMAIGMVVAGAPRLLVLGALAPAALVAAILLERMDGSPSRSK